MDADPLRTLIVLGAALALAQGLLGPWLAQRLRAPPQWALDLLITGAVSAWGLHEAWDLHQRANPDWLPLGQDSPEFLAYLVDAVWPHQVPGLGYRYSLYPWVSALLVQAQGLSPHQAGLIVATTALGLMPAAVWLLGAQLVPRPVALAPALLLPYMPPLVLLLGQPTDYGLCVLLQTLALAAGLALARTGSVLAALALGLSLGGLLMATPKALVYALLLIPVGLLSAPWRRPLRALLALVFIMGPIVGAWQVYAHRDPPRHTLEHAVFVVERDYAAKQKIELHTQDYGLPADLPERGQGSWRFGDPAALHKLPDTLRFLAAHPKNYPPLSARWGSFMVGYAEAVGWTEWPRWSWVLGTLGLLGAARRCPWPRAALASTLGLGLVLGGSWGAMQVPFTVRYTLGTLVLLPTLLAAGAWVGAAGLVALGRALLRRPGLASPAWLLLPLPAISLGLALREHEGLHRERAEALAWEEYQLRAKHPLNAVLQLRAQLQPGDLVLDATAQLSASAILMGKAELRRPTLSSEMLPFQYPPSRATRQYLILECAMSYCGGPLWGRAQAALAHSPRYRQLAPWIYEDLDPGLPGLIPPKS